jgi:hypothetical protein
MKFLTFTILFTYLSTATATVFWNHEQTRRDMNERELSMVARLGDCCVASFLNKTTIITANHCNKPINNGGKMQTGSYALDEKFQFVVTKILYKSDTLGNDFQIARIKWNNGIVPQTITPITKISSKKSDLTLGHDSVATPIYTLGFPIDLGKRATYASGHAKRFMTFKPSSVPVENGEITFLDHNISSIHCNSGGPIIDMNTNKLIGVLRGGPDVETDDSDLENPSHWNYASSMAVMLEKSTVLRQMLKQFL